MVKNSIKITIEQPKTIRQKVYEHLKQAIFSGELKSGDRLVESEIGKAIEPPVLLCERRCIPLNGKS